MRLRADRRPLLACVVTVLLGVAGCTSSAADGPSSPGTATTASASVLDTSTSATPDSASATSSSPAADPTPSGIDLPTESTPPTSLDPAAQEAADRAAVESQWIKYSDIYINIVRTSRPDRDALAATVAIDPARSNLSKSAEYFESKGQDTYGSVVHRLSWLEGINGAGEAVLSDCQDQSQYGAIDVTSGAKLSHGVERDNVKAHFVRGKDGIWRVSDVYFLLDVSC